MQPGAAIRIERWGGEEPLVGTVRYVEPSAFTEVSALGVEEQRVNVIADFQPGAAPLGDGYRVDARIVVWEAEDVLKVPASSLFRCNSGWCTFVVSNGRAHRQEVTVSQRSDLEAAIATGLNAGDTVILYPSEAIESNTPVTSRL
ncbi:hypothetical protein GS597_15090 [Synechococcales cyanobacterium C]|uniref:YknX-like C-terminal permuted SH3-like domain-containing protein n=1 Tax=Petrachloros mirabilis ULC683 TaxID=2781853 RepID=A0A8K2A962_9CYAN|nr:hypothetical protein [Petrachloros mirabilis]NCJ07810.1 hypothetical protein [Petrachloros mirabilis ULC683]